MINDFYGLGRQKFLEGQICWTRDNIKCMLVDTKIYKVDINKHEFVSSIPVPARVVMSGNLTGKSSTLGVADADDVLFPRFTGPTCGALVIFKDTGNAETSPLLLYMEDSDGLPVTPNGAPLALTWNSGPEKMFKI